MTAAHDPDRYTLVDQRLPLDNGATLAWTVDPDGSRAVWLLVPLCDGCDHEVTHGNAGPASAPHDQDGRLPDDVRRRLEVVTRRCGRPTTSGRPCHATVARPGDACHWHQEVDR